MISKSIRLLRFLLLPPLLTLSLPLSLLGQSIAEKKAHLSSEECDFDEEAGQFLDQINEETMRIQGKIRHLYETAGQLYQQGAPLEEYQALLLQIQQHKNHLKQLENQWRELISRSNRPEGYGLWHAPETSLEQLIIDYGSQDYVYLIPPEVGEIRLSIDSNLPIPRAAWSQMLELILTQNGVGIRSLNPYLRQLYLLKQNLAYLRLMTNQRRDLDVLPSDARIGFVLSPEPSDVKRAYLFLEKFINPQTTVLQALGRDLLLIGPVGEIQDLLKLYGFIASNRGEKEYRLLPVFKTKAEEMAKILTTLFDQSETAPLPSGENPSSSQAEIQGLKIIVLENMAQALFVVGTREEIRKAEEIVLNVEGQIGGVRDKTVFWYTVKHSEAEELADVLYKIYSLMIQSGTGAEKPEGEGGPFPGSEGPPPNLPQKEPPASLYGEEGFYQEGGFVVNPAPAEPRALTPTKVNNNRDNFIVDLKTGAIVMVVEAAVLPKLKELIRKLDVPKKMVQIETLLFEKILNRENSVGLNLFKIGEAACGHIHNRSGFVFNNIAPRDKEDAAHAAANVGVFEFFFSRKRTHSGIPAFDLAYRFLLNQDDVQINSTPSLLTVNQVPATIAINEDLSINTGVFEVETAKGVTLKDAFTRAQYGITISIKPTIHLSQHEEEDLDYDYVTLETDITFDTIQAGGNPNRPNVTRRHLTNQVQVPDGNTVILGGLRRKVSDDSREALPFIGELPGLGKLFSINTIRDSNTEMFIFITPHIIKDANEELTCLRQQLLCLRPGDVPYFLECVEEAHQYEKSKLMEGSLMWLFGRPRERYFMLDACSSDTKECGEYDGR